MRNSIVCAVSLCLLSVCAPVARAQDAFAGADNRPEIHGFTNGVPGGGKVWSFEELEKIAPLIVKMDAALKAGKLDEYAMYGYKIYNMSGVTTYKQLADVATGEDDPRELDDYDLLNHMDTLKKVLAARGKSDAEVLAFVQGLRHETSEEDLGNEVPQLKNEAIAQGKNALSGLRKFASNELRVYIQPPDSAQQFMLRHCIRRSLEQICAATHGALKLKFAKEGDANIKIEYEYKEPLWYTYQTHSTSIISEPMDGPSFSFVRLKVPMLATLHRYATEAESQEYCLREITRALGLAWHPVSRERFIYDFKDVVATLNLHNALINNSLSGLTGQARMAALVQNALTDSRAHGFDYYAGLAYLERGDSAMARRYLTNASPLLIDDAVSMHAAISKLMNSGDVLGAELVAMACINDDPSNDENSPATKEYNRVAKLHAASGSKSLPKLGGTEASLLAKIYVPSAPVVGAK